MRKTIAVLLPLLLAACASSPPNKAPSQVSPKPAAAKAPAQEEIYDYSENHGSYPDNYIALIQSYFAATLYDGHTARYAQFSKPRQEHMMHNQKLVYGYSSCVLIDAKNQSGNYTGYQLNWVFFKNGKIIRSQNISTGPRIIYIGRTVNCRDGG